jgi:methyl-accepting chemotaxis protein
MNDIGVSSNLRRTILLIAGCFVLVAIGVGGVAVVSRHYARQGVEQTEILTVRFLPGIVTLARLQEATLKLNGIILQFALGKDEATMNTQKAAFQAQSANVTQYVGELKAADDSDQTRLLVAAFVAAVQTYGKDAERLQAELKAGDFEKAMATLDKEVAADRQAVEAQLRLLSEHFFQLSQGAGQRTNALIVESSRFNTLASLTLVGATVLFLGITLVGARNINSRMLRVASSLGEGTSQVTSAASQVSTSSQSLAQGANEQAA